MKIDFDPSERVLAKMHTIHEMRQQGVIWEDISKQLGNHRTYLIALYKKYLEMKGDSANAS